MSTTTPNVQDHLGRTKVDSLVIGSSPSVIGGVWSTYTPVLNTGTFGTGSTIAGRYTTIGKTLFLDLVMSRANNTGAVDGSGAYTLSLPPGLFPKTIVTLHAAGSGSLSVGATNFDVGLLVSAFGGVGDISIVLSSDLVARVAWSSATQPFSTAGAMDLRAKCVIELV